MNIWTVGGTSKQSYIFFYFSQIYNKVHHKETTMYCLCFIWLCEHFSVASQIFRFLLPVLCGVTLQLRRSTAHFLSHSEVSELPAALVWFCLFLTSLGTMRAYCLLIWILLEQTKGTLQLFHQVSLLHRLVLCFHVSNCKQI